MLAANPYWKTLEFNWLKASTPFVMEDVNIYLDIELVLHTVFPTPCQISSLWLLPVPQSILNKQTNKHTNTKTLCFNIQD